MTDNLYAANAERDQLLREMYYLKEELNDDQGLYSDIPLPEFDRKRILLRLCILERGVKWLDVLISNEIETIPFTALNLQTDGHR